MTPELVNKIKQNLEEKWSPEQIVGRCPEYNISHTTIYTMIHKDQKLRKNLRHGGKKYRRLSAKTAGAGLIPGRVDIDKRPKIVDKKIRIGDWEADTIIGKNHEGAIFSCVERKTKYTKLVVMPDNKSSSVLSAIKQSMLAIKNKVLTITYDNGKEFVCHKTVNKILKSRSYFAKPYHSWQRGLNEHTNGLVRQYLPKGTSFANLTQEEVQWIEDQLNHRPRKSLNFQTPHEAFFSTRTPVVHLKL
jgi:IS30 family transposase